MSAASWGPHLDDLPNAAGRWLALTVSTWGALLGLFTATSLVAQTHATIPAAAIANIVTLCLCALGWADILWHATTGGLIWPRLHPLLRHLACVGTYAVLGGLWLVKAYVALDATFHRGVQESVWLVGFSVLVAVGCGLVAFSIAREQRT